MKPKVINPKETTRLEAFELWMNAPNPMVTFFKQINVTNLVRISKKYKLKFNMLLCWCIGKSASEVKEFYILPVQGKLYRYDKLAVNTIVRNKNGEVSSCDVPFSKKLLDFNKDSYRQGSSSYAEVGTEYIEINAFRDEIIGQLHTGTYIVYGKIRVEEFMIFWLEEIMCP